MDVIEHSKSFKGHLSVCLRDRQMYIIVKAV